MGLNPTWEEWQDQELILDERASAFIRYVKNFVLQGFGLANGGGLNLSVGSAGLNCAYINGFEIKQTGIVVKVLADGAVNHVFLKYVKTADIIAGTASIVISIETNTTGIPPSGPTIGAMKLGTATTAGGVITAISQENLKLEIHDAKLGTDLDADGKQFKNVGAPVAGTDVVRLVDLLEKLGDLAWKDSVRAATTANIALTGTPVIDTVALIVGDRVLVKDQTLPEENGIYVAAAGAWTRSTDCDTAAELEAAAVVVEEGSQAGTFWRQTSVNFVIGVGAVVWLQFAMSLTYGNVADLQDVTDGAESAGVSLSVARADHQHFHGNLGGGALHAVATPSVAGFMAAADKDHLDQLFIETALTTVDGVYHTIETIPIVADEAVLVEAHVVAKEASGHRAAFVGRALIYRTGVGPAVRQGTDQTDLNRESAGNFDLQIGVSGTDAIIEVRGVAATTVKWKCQRRTVRQVG